MSHSYHFVCISCGEVLDVGKLVEISETGDAVPIHFGGWRDQVTSHWLSGQSLWPVLERWHILHRGHEVRLLSEVYLDHVDPDGRLDYCDSADEVLGRTVTPQPDDEEDARDVPEDVSARIRMLHKL